MLQVSSSPMDSENDPPHADWTAWILQFILGTAVGAVGGFFLLARLRRNFQLETEPQLFFVTGSALITGALATLYGDRFWMGDSHRVIPPDEMARSRKSKLVSGLVMLVGMGLMGYALATTFG
jgi:hypothetical protein